MKVNSKIVSLQLLAAGYCKHAEFITIRGGSIGNAIFPAGFACIRHPEQGVILFDTGYAHRFYQETDSFPYSIYARITPVTVKHEDHAVQQLVSTDINPNEVRFIVISHFHADHIAGLRDFPNATFICSKKSYDAVRTLTGFRAVRHAFIPALLPDDFEARCIQLDDVGSTLMPEGLPFNVGHDIFQDGSLICVDVSGHAVGQLGLFVETEAHEYFLCADAVWSSRAYREARSPHPIAGLIMSDRRVYQESFNRIVELYKLKPKLRIIPSHCIEVWSQFIQGDELL